MSVTFNKDCLVKPIEKQKKISPKTRGGKSRGTYRADLLDGHGFIENDMKWKESEDSFVIQSLTSCNIVCFSVCQWWTRWRRGGFRLSAIFVLLVVVGGGGKFSTWKLFICFLPHDIESAIELEKHLRHHPSLCSSLVWSQVLWSPIHPQVLSQVLNMVC